MDWSVSVMISLAGEHEQSCSRNNALLDGLQNPESRISLKAAHGTLIKFFKFI
jgi:hypothetical protein